MLIWINGAFGAGKTTIAQALHEQLPDCMVFDPEMVGSLLGHLVPPSETGDFQDLPIWRTLTANVAVALDQHYETSLIVPMTVVDTAYFDEILSGIRDTDVQVMAFSLVVSELELRRRIMAQVLDPEDGDADEAARQWRLDQVERCVAAIAADPQGVPISNEDRAVSDVVAEIRNHLPGGL